MLIPSRQQTHTQLSQWTLYGANHYKSSLLLTCLHRAEHIFSFLAKSKFKVSLFFSPYSETASVLSVFVAVISTEKGYRATSEALESCRHHPQTHHSCHKPVCATLSAAFALSNYTAKSHVLFPQNPHFLSLSLSLE